MKRANVLARKNGGMKLWDSEEILRLRRRFEIYYKRADTNSRFQMTYRHGHKILDPQATHKSNTRTKY